MRRAQSSLEAVIAVGLLCAVLSALALVGLRSWRAAELDVARIAAARAVMHGGDPGSAAVAAVPPPVQPAARSLMGTAGR